MTQPTDFDPRAADYPALTAPRVRVNTPTSSMNRYAINSAHGDIVSKQVVAPIAYIDAYIGANAGYRNVNTLIQDSEITVPIKVNVAGSPLVTLTLQRVKVAPSFAAQMAMGALTSTVSNLIGALQNCEVSQPADAVGGIGGPASNPAYVTTVDRCWFHAQHTYPYADGYPWDGVTSFPLGSTVAGSAATTGTYMTDTQQAQGGTTAFQPNENVTPGAIRWARVSSAAGNWVLECVAAGTAGTGTIGQPTVQTIGGGNGGVLHTPSGRPLRLKDSPAGTEPSYMLQGGTARWVTVGVSIHSDGMQWTSGGNCAVTNTRIEGPSNDCALIQSASSPLDGANVPTKLVSFDNCLFITGQTDPASTHIIQVNQTGSISSYGTSGGSVAPGYYTWATGNVWSVNTSAWRSRPWYVSLANNYFGDLPAGGQPTFVQCIGTASRYNDHAIFVKDEATRDAGVAAQYGISLSAAQAMRTPGYDWTNNAPAVVSSVLNARLATFNAALSIVGTDGGAHQAKCDARNWIVWNNNRTATGSTLLHPTALWGGKVGFDANGYYTGA